MKTLDPAAMANFTGTEQWFRHSLARNILYTEGAQYVAETAGAYWLLDEIAQAQRTASLSVEDGNDHVVWAKHISFTDFPEPGIELWFTGGVILLPSEY
jgi:hypothetical protein